jgi:hypothetical protein
MTWNHRVIKLKQQDFEGDACYQFAEVYYDSENKPVGYGECFMVSDTIEGLQELADRLLRATTLPPIDEEDLLAEEQADDGYDDER